MRLETIANIFLIGGAATFSVRPEIGGAWWLMAIFLVGHAVYIWHGFRMRDSSVLQLNAGLILLDVYAIWIRV